MSLVLVRSIEIHSFLFCNGCLMDVKKCICSDFPDAISIITYFCVDVDCFFKNKMQDLQNKLTFSGFYGKIETLYNRYRTYGIHFTQRFSKAERQIFDTDWILN